MTDLIPTDWRAWAMFALAMLGYLFLMRVLFNAWRDDT
jgi:hypothetical protein